MKTVIILRAQLRPYSVASVRYSFFVHRTAPRWRLVIAEAVAFPERTAPDQ